jgi:hypothetical protein
VTQAADKPDLFAAIRRDAQDGHSIRGLALISPRKVHDRFPETGLTPPPSGPVFWLHDFPDPGKFPSNVGHVKTP